MGDQLVRVGVIGGGIWGTYHLKATRELEKEGKVQLVAVAARTDETAERQSKVFGINGYSNYQEMIDKENLDAVTIATPDHLHKEMTLYALNKGKHVFVEKPMDLTTTGCREMARLAQENGLLLQVDLHKRYDPYNIDMMRKVRAGKIGEPYYAHAYMENKIVVPSEWLASWSAFSSPFWFIGVHKYDFIRWVTGQEAKEVVAHGRKGKLEQMGINTYDAISAHIIMDGGMTCTIDVSWVLPKQFEAVVNQGLRILGSEGLIELDSQDRGMRYCFSSDGTVTPNYGAVFFDQSVFGWETGKGYFIDAIKDFLYNTIFLMSGGTLQEIEGTYPSGQDGVKITQVAEAVHMSIEVGRPVSITEVGG